jgi:flagellar biosynthetic protein FliR
MLKSAALVFDEAFVGSFIGMVARVLLAALETAGTVIAMQSSLSSAITFDPGAAHPETLPAGMFGALAVALLFVTDLHAMLLRAVVDSYQAFPAGAVPPFDDMSRAIAQLVSRSFLISVEMAAPYLVLGTVFYVVLGLIGRIMPQLQVFYVGLPLQVMGGLVMLALTVTASMLWFLGTFDDVLTSFTRLP